VREGGKEVKDALLLLSDGAYRWKGERRKGEREGGMEGWRQPTTFIKSTASLQQECGEDEEATVQQQQQDEEEKEDEDEWPQQQLQQ